MRLRKFAAVSTLALTAAGLTAVTAPAANAVSGTLAYSCETPLGAKSFNTVFDTDAPTAAYAAVNVKNLTVKVTAPQDLMDLATSVLGATYVQGKADVTVKVGGVAKTVSANIPKTKIESGKPTVISIKAPLNSSLKPGQKIDADKYTAHLQLVDNAGAEKGALAVPCSPPAGNLTVDTLAKAAPVATKTTVKAKGAKGKATITVKVAGAKTGKVKIALKGKKKVNKTVAVKNGVAKVTIKKLKKGKYKVQASYLATPAAKASKSKTVSFKVK